MQAKTRNSILFLVLLGTACSKKSSDDRSAEPDVTSAETDVTIVKNANSESRPNDNGEGIPGYTQASVPLPITGTNLVEIQISTNCVNLAATSCSQVRLSANVKVNSAQPLRFAKDTLNALSIKSSSWEFKNLPPNTTCESIGDALAFNPRCTISSGSLEDATIKAVLSIVSNDGSSFHGASPDSKPATGSVYYDFMLVDASAGLVPSHEVYDGASLEFSEIWQDLKSGVYFTNSLVDFSAFSALPMPNWTKAKSLCESINSGDGAGKWHLPSALELCGSSYVTASMSGGCNGGIYQDGINLLPGDKFPTAMNFWSSTAGAAETDLFTVNLSIGGVSQLPSTSGGAGVLCFHN